jgi:hypothetical protein
MHRCSRFLFLQFTLVLFVCLGLIPEAEARVSLVPVPQELQSQQFTVLVNGKPADVAHAAASYDYLNIESTGPVTLSITAKEPGFWNAGVDIQPWRLGIRPTRKGDTIQFKLKDPAKLSISRPGDFLNHSRMLFVFVSRPAAPPPAKPATGFHLVDAGVHRGSLNPKSGETYYLAPGAVIYGSLNLWNVDNVKVLGHGVIVYDGPQNPEDDDGWMQKKDWHCIGAVGAHHVEIHGVTCLVRSRTWSIQMKDSGDFLYDDLRVVGGDPGNANQDGMDWLGGGNTVVRDSFFRASDDVFAVQGNWDGYGHDAMVKPGHDVANITIDHSVLSTSISNIVRAGWPEKNFNSRNFTLKNSDILHGGIGSCGLPFALFTFWGKSGASGNHSGYTFENLWLDDWYSLFQIEQEQPGLRGFVFKDIWSLDQPALVGSRLQGPVKDVRVENVKYGQALVTSNANLPVTVGGGAEEPKYSAGDQRIRAVFRVSPAVLQPGVTATFTALAAADPHARYTWLFGDGTTAHGQHVRHRYADTKGTALDGTDANGSGAFRVLLHVEDKQGNEDWSEQGIAVVGHWHDAGPLDPSAGQSPEEAAKATSPGLDYRIYPGTWPELPSFATEIPTLSGVAPTLVGADARGFTRYAVAYDGFLEVPAEGGYTLHLLARDGARLVVDGLVIAQTGPPFAEVCGSAVNAIRSASGTIGLRAGKHVLRLEALQSVSPGSPRLMWQGPGIGLSDVPAKAFSHRNVASIQARPGRVSTVGP